MDLELAGTFLIAGIFIVSLLALNGQITETNAINALNVNAQNNATQIAMILRTDLSRIGQGLECQTDAIRSVSETSLDFISDVDNDGDLDTVAYRLGSPEETTATENPEDCYLYRAFNGVENDVALGLTSLEFSFFNSNGAPTITTTDVRTIGIMLSVETPFYYQGATGAAVWQGVVTPKNLKNI